MTPLIGTSLSMSAGMKDWLDAAQDLYVELAEIPLPLYQGSSKGTALDLLADRSVSLKSLSEAADVLTGPAFDEALSNAKVTIGNETFHYPQTGDESDRMFVAIEQHLKTDDADSVLKTLTRYKKTMVEEALDQVCDSPEQANMVSLYLDKLPRLMPSLTDELAGLDTDNFDVLHAAIGLVEKFVNETTENSNHTIESLDWNTLGTVNYGHNDGRRRTLGQMTPDVGEVPQNVVKKLVMQMKQRYGDTSDSVGFTSELIDAVFGVRRRG